MIDLPGTSTNVDRRTIDLPGTSTNADRRTIDLLGRTIDLPSAGGSFARLSR